MITARSLSALEAMEDWEEAEVFLQAAVTDPDPIMYMRNVKARVFSGMHTLWKAENEFGEAVAYMVTALYTPDGIHKTVQLYLATSEGLDEIVSQMDQFTVWAMQHDIDFIEVIGRKGWEKALKAKGFMYNHTSLVKRITEELH